MTTPRPQPDITPELIRHDFDEDLSSLLNLASWRAGHDLDAEYARLEHEVRLAVACEDKFRMRVRDEIHPLLAQDEQAPPGAGRYAVSVQEIADVHKAILFNGLVEGCDGNSNIHSTLPLTIYQIGVSLTSYQGDLGCWQRRLFRRDLRQRDADTIGEVMNLLKRRGRRGSLDERKRDPMSELGRRGLMIYGERCLLARASKAPWRLGHGSPAPLELLTTYFTDLVIESIRVVRELFAHQRFVFVASQPADRAILTIGQGLHPLEYVIVGTLRDRLESHFEEWTQTHEPSVDTAWDGQVLTARQWMTRFRDEIAPRIVYGLYRADLLAPPQLFYAHVNHSHVAARIALADSVLQPRRGFPLLIDMADQFCRAVYGGDSLRELAEAAYVAAGAPFRYGSERDTRDL